MNSKTLHLLRRFLQGLMILVLIFVFVEGVLMRLM